MASNGPFLAAEYFVIVFTPLNIASPKKALFATIAKKKPGNLRGISGLQSGVYMISQKAR